MFYIGEPLKNAMQGFRGGYLSACLSLDFSVKRDVDILHKRKITRFFPANETVSLDYTITIAGKFIHSLSKKL